MLSQRVITTSSYSCGQQQMVGGEQGLILSSASEKKNNKKNKKINGLGTSQARGRTRIFVFHSPPVSMCFSTSFQEPFIPRTFDPLDTLPDLFHGMLDETKSSDLLVPPTVCEQAKNKPTERPKHPGPGLHVVERDSEDPLIKR